MTHKPSIELVQSPKRLNISFNGRLLYSQSSTPEKRLERLPQTSQTLYVIVSPLLFYGVESLEIMLPDNSYILAVEQNPDIYKMSIDYFKAGNFTNTSYLLIGEKPVSEIISDYTALRIRRIVPVKLNLGYMLNRKFYDSFLTEAENLLQLYWKNRITTIHMGRLWCRNIFHNLPHLAGSSSLSTLITDKPIVTAGAGESLEYSIDFLKKYRDSFFLAAADTAVTSLLQNNLKPDLVIVLESQHANLYDFYSAEAFNLPAAVDLTSSSELIRKFNGPLYFFISEFDRCSLFESLKDFNILPPVIPPLGSVGIASLFISSLLTQQNIFYTGLDFSFIPDKYHASGSPTHILNMMNENRTSTSGFFSSAWSDTRKKVTDRSGRKVFTDLVMMSYADILKDLANSSDRFYNIGKVGIASSGPPMIEEDILTLLNYPKTGTADYYLIDFDNEQYDPDKAAARKKVISFLQNEIDFLDKTLTAVVDFQNIRNENSILPAKLADSLKKIDYTWLFFPDTGIQPSASASFLKRFLYSASWFRNHLQNTITRLKS